MNGLVFWKISNGVRVYRKAPEGHSNPSYPFVNEPWILETENGDRAYFMNDKLHRVNGPAIERKDGTTAWFINGKPTQPFPFGEEGKMDVAKMIRADQTVRA